MLKIGSNQDSAEAPTKPDKGYGRQLSVQELFDGKKFSLMIHLSLHYMYISKYLPVPKTCYLS